MDSRLVVCVTVNPRPDYIVIDDLDDDVLCKNDKLVHDLTDWVKEALFGALDVGRGRFIMVGNLISKNSVLYNLSRTKGVFLSKIVAVDRNGEPVWKEKWTKEEAQAYRDFVGYRAWEKEMMHNPIVDGTIFARSGFATSGCRSWRSTTCWYATRTLRSNRRRPTTTRRADCGGRSAPSCIS